MPDMLPAQSFAEYEIHEGAAYVVSIVARDDGTATITLTTLKGTSAKITTVVEVWRYLKGLFNVQVP